MKFSIIIPTFGDLALLSKCIESLRRQEKKANYEIIVVDDGSPTTQQMALEYYCKQQKVICILKSINSGFSNSINKGIQAATGDVYVLCNNDIIFTQPILDAYAKTFLIPDVGIIGALLSYPNKKTQHAGLAYDKIHNSFIHVNKHVLVSSDIVHKSKYMIAVTGALFAVKKEVVGLVGAFNEDYFVACEDTDYCLRAWEAGFSVYYEPKIFAIHLEGATRGNDPRTKRKKGSKWIDLERAGIKRFQKATDSSKVLKLESMIAALNRPIKKVEVGSGFSPHPGYLHLDIRKDLPQLDYVCDFSKQPLPFENNEIKELLANHVIEHLSFRKLPFVLKEWERVLEPGGKVMIRTPNLEFILNNYALEKTTPEWPGDEKFIRDNYGAVTPSWWAILKLFSGQDYDANFHHLCFDFKTLKEVLERYGFENVKEEKFEKTFSPGELQVTAIKKK